MIILSIETSCDETAVSVVRAGGGLERPEFAVLGNALFSQVELHKAYGGVFPNLAKREHAKNLPPLLVSALTQASLLKKSNLTDREYVWEKIKNIVAREEDLYDGMREILSGTTRPGIDIIAVTTGPGLEPALWVGISFALALGTLWNIPVIPTNHMEGHITSVLLGANDTENNRDLKDNHIQFPALALLISGGHTELVNIKRWGDYSVIGETRDDAVGEAFDKVARILGLLYPGGPEISRLAEYAREKNIPRVCVLPRPMIHSGDNDFSFSGLKTAVLYYVRDHFTDGKMTDTDRMDIAREFEDAVVDVLLSKTKRILSEDDVRTLIVAGGVIANKNIRRSFESLPLEFPGLSVRIPSREMATDNSVMIACAGYMETFVHSDILSNPPAHITARGNAPLGKILS